MASKLHPSAFKRSLQQGTQNPDQDGYTWTYSHTYPFVMLKDNVIFGFGGLRGPRCSEPSAPPRGS